MSRSIALVSSAEARHHDTDLSYLSRAFGDRGIVVDVVDWDNAATDWSQYEMAIVRSPWDYHRRYNEFLAWLDVVAKVTVLHNSAEMIRWNTDKQYLTELVEEKIPVIPTLFISELDDVTDLESSSMFTEDIVVKPTVSAGSNNTERHQGDAGRAVTHIRGLLESGKVAMVQPYQRFIDERGETGMVYFNGRLSHSFRKGAILASGDNIKNGLFVEEEITPREASEQEREVGAKVLRYVTKKFGAAPLYARVDMVRGSAGVPILMELEMAEPSFFLHTALGSAERFAAAVVARR